MEWILISFIHLLLTIPSISAVDFLFNSFNSTDLILVGDARVDSSVVRLTNDSNQFSIGRAFFPTRLPMTRGRGGNATTQLSSLSTSFIFSILPQIPSSPGFGLAFVLSNSTSPPGAISGQYFGLFSNSTRSYPAPLLAVEFDTGQNPEFNDPDGNHVGIDLNNIQSSLTRPAGYYRAFADRPSSPDLEFVPLDMRTGKNIRVWIELDGPRFQINVTIAPAEEPRPSRPLISYSDPEIANYVSPEMFVGFSASKVTWVEAQRILAWSLTDTGRPARELNTSNLQVFLPESPSSSSSSSHTGLIAGVSCGIFAFLCFTGFCCYYYFRCYRKKEVKIGEDDEEVEEWEAKYWPHRFTYQDLLNATNGFSREQLLGSGGFGKVYKGRVLQEEEEVAVKCVSHDSKQGLREFMAEISSMGRLQHKSLIQLRGWCRKGTQLMLVYDCMPNGSLNRWIFPDEEGGGGAVLGWAARQRVLTDVAEGLVYLHHGWDQVVLHRDIKSSNILLDSEMRGRLGDFGLAKLYEHGEGAPSSTRVVGTIGYLAPELGHVPAPTAASDVYSFGVVLLEVACGRRPIERAKRVEDEDWVLVEWVREMYGEGRLGDAADRRMMVGKEEYVVEEMELVLKLGLACCHPDPEQRPTMREVVAVLVGEGIGRPAGKLKGEEECTEENRR